MEKAKKKNSKIKFIVTNYTKDDTFVESIWAKQKDNNKFVLKNSPYYAYGYSAGDTVSVKRKDEDLIVDKVIKRGRHSTYRIFLKKGSHNKLYDKYWRSIEKLGCSYEQASKSLFAIDVPPGVNVREVYEYLEKGEKDNVWEFKEGHYHES